MKKALLTGLFLLIPVAITFWVVKICFNLLSDPLLMLITPVFDSFGTNWDHPYILHFFARIASILILLFGIFFIGFMTEHLFEGWIQEAIDRLVSRMPIIKTVHKVVKEVLKQFTSSKQSPLEKPAILPYIPNASYVISSQLPHLPEPIHAHLPGFKAYYMPTAPQPLHGILLFSKEGKLVEANSEEMIRFIISCGVVS